MRKIALFTLSLLFVIMLAACGRAANTSAPSLSPSSTPEQVPSEEPSPDMTNQVGSGTLGDFDVEIIDFQRTKDHNDNPAVIINYAWTNNSDKATSFMFSIYGKVFQRGVECDIAVLMGTDDYDFELQMKEIEPGTTLTIQCAYVLSDAISPIEIQVAELFSLVSPPPMVTQTFDIA